MHVASERTNSLKDVILEKNIYNLSLFLMGTDDGGAVVKVLRYKSEGRWFDSRWCHWNFSLT
jgi:hypothetical protein